MNTALSKAQLPGELLREVARLYTRAQRAVAECCRTSTTQCHLLVELGRSGPLPLNEIGARLSLEKSWVSRAVEGLVERGWATKEPNPLDARSWLVTLTADGEERVRELNATLDNHAARVLEHLSERDRASVEKSLLILLKALREDIDIASCCPAPQASARTKVGKSCC
ncbi:MarR family winged helix-turn-helix transcriptional regulator [Piscinibacter defluvii]|uniref:MarR family winged helix-turn-helix transcriptional regulator n=1 Tax=Piscinibacter defluvii TaxID=1796922 RepID=UPI000FDE002C|nr:MarR family winged helix-turn-helix transcriptional regulator [Piscinibacter defluvii]